MAVVIVEMNFLDNPFFLSYRERTHVSAHHPIGQTDLHFRPQSNRRTNPAWIISILRKDVYPNNPGLGLEQFPVLWNHNNLTMTDNQEN
jgi:hypothetical protein